MTGYVIEASGTEAQLDAETSPFWVDWERAVRGEEFVYWTHLHGAPRACDITRKPRLSSSGKLYLEIQEWLNEKGDPSPPRTGMICIWKTDAPAMSATRVVFPKPRWRNVKLT